MNEEELYNHIVDRLSNGNFLQLNGKPINLSELNNYLNAQQKEIERLTKQNKALNEMYELTKKEYIRLNNIIKTKDEGIKALTEDLCETAKELEEATNTIKMALDYIQNAEGNDMNYVATLLLGHPIEIEEKREQVLTVIGGKQNE